MKVILLFVKKAKSEKKAKAKAEAKVEKKAKAVLRHANAHPWATAQQPAKEGLACVV